MLGAAPDVAIVGHLESLAAYTTLFNELRGPDLPPVCPDELRASFAVADPLPLSDVTLRSTRGITLTARYFDLGLLVDEGFSPRAAVRRVKMACQQARACGARLGALGGFSSIVGESCRFDPSVEYGIPFTTGNTLTAAVIAEQVCGLPLDIGGARIAVVGAGGDVGSGVCRILAEHGAHLRLVGRTVGPLAALARQLRGSAVLGFEEACGDADVVVLVASVPEGALALRDVARQAWVLDAGHPSNGDGDHPRHFVAGRVVHDHPPQFDLLAMRHGGYELGESHACLAEAEVLAFERRWEAFSGRRGHIVPARARLVSALAAKHGIRPAPLRRVAK